MWGHSTTQAVENHKEKHSEKTLSWAKLPFLFIYLFFTNVFGTVIMSKKDIGCHLKVYEKAGYFFRWIPDIGQESLSFKSKVDDTPLYVN